MSNETEILNPPSYPTHKDSGTWTEGLTMLDHFAGLAMQGLLASLNGNGFSAVSVAEEAYDVAANMLIERQKHL